MNYFCYLYRMKEEQTNVNSLQELQNKMTVLEGKNTLLEEENLKLRQELLYYKRFCYGRRSEKRMPEKPRGPLFALFEGQEHLPEETPDIQPIAEEIRVESYNRKKKKIKKQIPRREKIPADIERRTRIIHPADVDWQTMVKIGEDVREILHYIPGQFYVDRIVRPIYKAKEREKDSLSTPLYQAPVIETFIDKSFAGTSLLAQIIIGKYMDHLPVYRQLAIFKRGGVQLSASSVGGWIHEVATQLYPFYQSLVENVLASGYVQIDESTLPVIDNEKKRAVKGYIWAVRDVINNQVFFHYDRGSRSQKVLISLLRDYQGVVQSDGYEAYSIYEDKKGVLLLGCWAHARRKFENALSEDKKQATLALDYIGLLYQIEANMKEKNFSPEQIAQERERLAYPILMRFEQWMLSTHSGLLPKSLLAKAIEYTFSIYHRLIRYVADGRYQIDNNGIENAIRPLAIGRKNYLFCGNHDSAEDTALYYSLLGSCKLAGVNPMEWFLEVLENIKDCKKNDLGKFFPQNWAKTHTEK